MRGAAVSVADDAMRLAAANLAALEGIDACLEGAATLAGLRRFYDDGVITSKDRVVLVNTGSARGERGQVPGIPTVRTAGQALAAAGITQRAS